MAAVPHESATSAPHHCRTAALRSGDLRGDDDHHPARPLQALLERKSGLVVQQRLVPMFALKDNLARKKRDLRKLPLDVEAELLRLGDGVRAGGDPRGRRNPLAPGEVDVLVELALEARLELFGRALALELPRV